MEMPVNHFKRALAGPGIPLGTWLMSASVIAAEALGHLGFDFVVVDTEHVPVDVPQTLGILQAVAGTPAQSIVRLAWNDPVLAKRALDIGAQTLMFPFIETAAEAKLAVESTRYAPHGKRGFAAMHRASRYGTVPDFAQRANAEVGVIVQVETPEAMSRLEEIAAVDGVDALFVGPGDLAAACGLIGQIGHAEVQAHLRGAAERCRRIGKPCGTVGPTPAMVNRFVDYGYSFVTVASDMGMLMRQAGEFLGCLRNRATEVNTGSY